MNLTKTQKIIGGVAAGVVVLVGGVVGTFVKVQQDEAAKKEAARLAYENRAIVEENCIMNGYGEGNCSFTNIGRTTGALCGAIQVDGPGTVTSSKFCSGPVQPQSTVKVEFHIPEVDELCDNALESWTEKCAFTFVPNEPAVKSGPVI